ncbi:Non-classical export protein 2 homolog [Taphrina deformans PYCC 5710]|uniref:Non-classical export protein 2 homolog n=1 Tax=Taphrina deformans (strain PYCC 5710 / ATCC 11124 / CBS 356.35 / IMI 108563 / JCM 9778 / NBRC 8474) TaxID=1097556 RepID=R4X8P0_TAPDE|nr:Non-classical export protein 2 homolog [Taphrina deformans PYCC 5710]|eukprot:CCG82004.1 Non-classical export protein 2 homolog [Taphrina deformans PYCC 5710]
MVSKYDRPTLAGHAFHWPILILQFLCGVFILAFSAAVVAQHHGNTASAINYEVFLGIIILLWVFAIAGAPFLPILGQEMIRAPIDGVLMLLTLAGGIALATRLRVHSCRNDSYVDQPLFDGSANQCRLLQATCAFTWFSFAGFLVSFIGAAISFTSGAPATQRGSRKPRGPSTV